MTNNNSEEYICPVAFLLARFGTSCHSLLPILPEFSLIITIAIYIPPQANMDNALATLHNIINRHNTKNLDTTLIVTGDFNRANLKQVMSNFFQPHQRR